MPFLNYIARRDLEGLNGDFCRGDRLSVGVSGVGVYSNVDVWD